MTMIGICDTCGCDVPIYTRYPEYISCGPCEDRYQMAMAIQWFGDKYNWDGQLMEQAIRADGDRELLAHFLEETKHQCG